MDKDEDDVSLTGKLLVAMPSMGDARFRGCVIFLFLHNSDGAMGVVVNKPAGVVHIEEKTAHRSAPTAKPKANGIPFHFGGPVDDECAVMLHSGDGEGYDATLKVNDQFTVTMDLKILVDQSRGHGPPASLLTFGYAGWRAGQLERELQENSWLVCESDPHLVFDVEPDEKWKEAVRSIGISPNLLSMSGGTA